ncbi:penicillin-binding protein 1C [bacterium]|nr:MAG: penicillin-binding protein 1C [bacterium]
MLKRLLLLVFATGFIWTMGIVCYLALKKPLFDEPYSILITDKNGRLLHASVATDEQWRFKADIESEKIRIAVVQFEDQYFDKHWGINPFSLWNALKSNWTAGKIKSGGSTITMQVVRLMRKNKARTYGEKFIEIQLAWGLEWMYSKDEILDFWLNHAPFGGNVVGLEAASWRYFGHTNRELSWAEASLLSVLPNAPSKMNPGKNRAELLQKRNRLLLKLKNEGILTQIDYELSLLESIPEKPGVLPNSGSHIAQSFQSSFENTFQTTLDADLQERVKKIAELRLRDYQPNAIYNAAVCVIHVPSGEVKAYVGNATLSPFEGDAYVDIIQAPRSSGSILKPLLYASSVDAGLVLPNQLISDVPKRFGGGFTPKNYDDYYRGFVPLKEALYRSLNVPFVELLSQFGVGPFLLDLEKLGLTHINKSAGHYGLSLILGGAEVSLWNLSSTYANLAKQLQNQQKDEPYSIHILQSDTSKNNQQLPYSKGTIWSMFEAMTQVIRPEEQAYWESFSSTRKVAWKTGTSYGNRDAWSIGITPDWVVGVWVGNADGVGRPELTGTKSAAPILFDVFDILPETAWFPMPKDLALKNICLETGFLAGDYCDVTDLQWIPEHVYEQAICPYHKPITLDKSGEFQVNSSCYALVDATTENRLIFPALQALFYQYSNPSYRPLPPFLPGCESNQTARPHFVYPENKITIFLPLNQNNERESILFEAVHSQTNMTLYWHLDDSFLGTTTQNHSIFAHPKAGKHYLTITDENGNRATREFTIAY